MPVIPVVTWLVSKVPGSSIPDQLTPGESGGKPAPGKPDAEGDKPGQDQPGQAPGKQPVSPGKPGESRQEIKSVPSGATEKGDNVPDFIG